MSKFEKAIEKLLDSKSIISFRELEFILTHFGYIEKKTGKTSGSRIAFINMKSNHIIRLHKPHPSNEIKKYVKNAILEELIKQKLI